MLFKYIVMMPVRRPIISQHSKPQTLLRSIDNLTDFPYTKLHQQQLMGFVKKALLSPLFNPTKYYCSNHHCPMSLAISIRVFDHLALIIVQLYQYYSTRLECSIQDSDSLKETLFYFLKYLLKHNSTKLCSVAQSL